jgi:hypothetical protein
MPALNQLVCGVGLSILLLATASCSGDDPVSAEGSPPSAQATDDVRVLDSGRGSAEEPAPLDPGHYAIPFLGAADDAPWGEVELPAGWGQDRLLLATGPDLDPHLRRVELLAVGTVAPDPCQGVLQPVRARVPAIVAALTEQRTVRASDARSVAVDGYSGQLVQFRVPSGLAVEKCWDGQSLKPFGLAGGGYTSVFPGWTYRVWVLDVQGNPLVIMAAHGPETSPTELAQLTTLVEGITFVGPR